MNETLLRGGAVPDSRPSSFARLERLPIDHAHICGMQRMPLTVIISLAVNKQHILDEIRRTAKANGGEPLGRARFEQETGIKYHDWWGKCYARWGEALQEAGFAPNTLRGAFSDEFLLEKLAAFIRELGMLPRQR